MVIGCDDMKKRVKMIIISIILVVIAGIFFAIGFYFTTLSKANYRMGKVLNGLREQIEPLFYIDTDYALGDDFTLDTEFLVQQLESDYYERDSLLNTESLEKYRLIDNFSKLNSKVLFQHSNKNKKLFIDILGMLGDEQLMHSKLFVEDATEYYYIDQAVSNYVDTGNCNYFENYNKDITVVNQLYYINDLFWSSLKKNLKEEYFQKYRVKEKIEGKERNVEQIVIRFTNKNIHEIMNHVIQDLKKDKRAHNYLSSIFSNFDSFKIDEDYTFLDKDESYTFNIYSTTLLYKPLKYEIVHLSENNKETITYEGDFSSGIVYYTKDSQLVYQITCHFNKDVIQLQIQDIYGKELGELKVEKKGHLKTIHYLYQNNNKNQEIVYSSKYEHYKKNVSYDNVKKLSFNFSEDGINHLSGEMMLTLKAKNKAIIEEDVANAMLESKLSDDEKNKVHEEWTRVWERMKK